MAKKKQAAGKKAPAKAKKTQALAKKVTKEPKKAPAKTMKKTPEPKKTTTRSKKTFSVAEFSEKTYLTQKGVNEWLKQGKLKATVKIEGLDRLMVTQDQTSNRISFSIIIAALIIGSALIVISKTPPLFYGISLIGIIGFLAATIMGIWLLVAILKKGRL